MRASTSSLLRRLAELMHSANMQEVASVLGVSLATAYRYRKIPSDMSVAAFERLAGHFGVPVSMNLLYRENDVIAAEEARYKYEEEIANLNGWRFVTSQHFTVNCELDDFTRAMFEVQYGGKYSDAEARNYSEIRRRRRKLYLSGSYRSEEIISGPSYVDFFYSRGSFSHIPKALRDRQLEEVISTSLLPHVTRSIYSRATPELPTILNFSNMRSIVRVEDLTIIFTDDECSETVRVLRSYADNSEYKSRGVVRSFFANPLNPQE